MWQIWLQCECCCQNSWLLVVLLLSQIWLRSDYCCQRLFCWPDCFAGQIVIFRDPTVRRIVAVGDLIVRRIVAVRDLILSRFVPIRNLTVCRMVVLILLSVSGFVVVRDLIVSRIVAVRDLIVSRIVAIKNVSVGWLFWYYSRLVGLWLLEIWLWVRLRLIILACIWKSHHTKTVNTSNQNIMTEQTSKTSNILNVTTC